MKSSISNCHEIIMGGSCMLCAQGEGNNMNEYGDAWNDTYVYISVAAFQQRGTSLLKVLVTPNTTSIQFSSVFVFCFMHLVACRMCVCVGGGQGISDTDFFVDL
jgi:hypothetical protein